jgi:hypothetical protein
MFIATLITEGRAERSFWVEACPIHVIYCGKLWSRQQGGDWEKNSTYRQTGALVLDDTMRTDNQQKPEEKVA